MPSHVDPAIYVAANVGDRPVTARVMQALGLSQAAAVGHLVMFWGAAALNAPDGDVASFSDAQIEGWARWTGKRGRFATWVRDKHLDPETGKPGDWDEFAGRLTVSRQKSRDKKRQQREEQERLERERKAKEAGLSRGQDRDNDGDSPGDVPGTLDAHAYDREQSADGKGQRTSLPDSPAGLTVAQRLCIAANQAVTDRWGESTRPYAPGHGPSHDLAVDVGAAGVPVEFAERSIVRQIKTKKGDRPGSMSYFLPGIKQDWQEHGAALQASGSPKVPALDVPPRRPARNAGPDINDILAGVDMVLAASGKQP